MAMRLVTAGGDFSYRNVKRINSNFTELEDKLLGWEDLRFPASSINPVGLAGGAAIDTTSTYMGTLLFDAAGTEIVVGQAQFPHAKKLDSEIHPHVHWAPTSTNTGNVFWRFEYQVADINGLFPGVYTVLDSVATSSGVVGKHQIDELGTIDTTGFYISAMMIWKLSRIGGDVLDTYTADARLLEFDIHYRLDEIGSTEEYSK